MTIEIAPTLSIMPQITNVLNTSRTIDNSYTVLDSFMRVLHFRKHHWYTNGADTIKMKVNDGTNDNIEDTDNTVVNDGGLMVFLPTSLIFSQIFEIATPNTFILNTTYVNEISKIVSIDQSLMNLIFTFSSAPSVNGTKYTRGNLVLNVISGDHDLSGSVLTVTPDSNNDICVTVSVGDYTDTFNGEAFGFNTMVAGKYMPKVTTLRGSDSHIVLKLKWFKSDTSTYAEDWVVLQNTGDTPTSGSMYLTVWQYSRNISTLLIGPEGFEYTALINRMHNVTLGFFRITKTIHGWAFNINYSSWDRTQDYTNDSIGQTMSFSSTPLQSWLLRYENDIFMVYQGEARLSDGTQLLVSYDHIHGSLNNRVVETTQCRTRKVEAPVYQSTGSTCSYSFVGIVRAHGHFSNPARVNTDGSWSNETITGTTNWVRDTDLYYGLGVNHTDAGKESSQSTVFINYNSNLSFDFEKCEVYDNDEYNIEPDLPNTLYVDDYIDHTHIEIMGTNAEFGAPLEALLGSVSTPTTYSYTNGALALNAVLGGTYYNTPLRYILAYDNGYHIVDTLAEPFKFSNQLISG